MNKWNSKNVMWMLLYTVLYVVGTVLVCLTGIIHPVFFVCYQVTAGILLTGIVLKAFDRVKAPGAAVFLSAGVIIMLFIMEDATVWHLVPVIIIAIAAEVIRCAFKYSWAGNLAATVMMTFSTFGYYARIWFSRAYTYEAALEEMPAGYADTLMSYSPTWSLPAALVIGIALSIVVANITARLFKLDRA